MPSFSIQIHLGAPAPVLFEGWIDTAFGNDIPKGTAFATGMCMGRRGVIVTNGDMFFLSTSSKQRVKPGDELAPGAYVVSGSFDGEGMSQGKPFCLFVPDEGAPDS